MYPLASKLDGHAVLKNRQLTDGESYAIYATGHWGIIV
jgi:hypothetical protein